MQTNFTETNDVSFYWVPVRIAEIEYQNEIYYIVANGQTWELAGMYKTNSIKAKYFRIPEDKVYKDERSIYFFTKKYSLEEKNNMQS